MFYKNGSTTIKFYKTEIEISPYVIEMRASKGFREINVGKNLFPFFYDIDASHATRPMKSTNVFPETWQAEEGSTGRFLSAIL